MRKQGFLSLLYTARWGSFFTFRSSETAGSGKRNMKSGSEKSSVPLFSVKGRRKAAERRREAAEVMRLRAGNLRSMYIRATVQAFLEGSAAIPLLKQRNSFSLFENTPLFAYRRRSAEIRPCPRCARFRQWMRDRRRGTGTRIIYVRGVSVGAARVRPRAG